MRRVYFDDNPDPFFYAVLRNDKENFARTAKYVYRQGKFPTPPIIMPSYYDAKQFELVDGNRRMVALMWAQRMYAYKQSGQQLQNGQSNLSELALPNHEQEMWICIPNWSTGKRDERIEEYQGTIW